MAIETDNSKLRVVYASEIGKNSTATCNAFTLLFYSFTLSLGTFQNSIDANICLIIQLKFFSIIVFPNAGNAISVFLLLDVDGLNCFGIRAICK